MKALILNGVVVDLSETEFEVHESLTWVDCDDTVKTRDLYDGKKFTSAETLTEEETAALQLRRLRHERDKKLTETDYWAYQDTPTMTQAQTDYRQALRDITDTYSSMNDEGFAWPTKPE